MGAVVEAVPASNSLVAYWFTYTPAGDARDWLVAQGDISGPEAALTVYQASGGVFDQPSQVALNPWGEATVRFTDCTNAVFDYASTGGDATGQILLQRLSPDVDCQATLAAAQTTFVTHRNAWLSAEGDWFFEGCVQLGDSESHGAEVFSFAEDTLHFEIENYASTDCSGPMTLQVMDFQVQRMDKQLATLDGEPVIANRVSLVDPDSGQSVKQLFYFDDRGQSVRMTHGILDGPQDEDGFPAELHTLFFNR